MKKKSKRTLTPNLRFPEFRKAPGWDQKKVQEIITTVTPPKKLTTSDYLAKGRFPIIDQSQNYICGWTNDNESVITSSLPVIVFGDHTCVLKLVDQPFAQGADGIKIIIAKQGLTTEFLYHALRCRPLVMEDYKRHFSILKDRPIAFPNLNIGEQQKIAECLSSLDELITAEGRALEALKAHKKGLMQQLFPKPGQTQPRLRVPEFRKSEWVRRSVGDVLQETCRPIDMDDEQEYSLVTVKRRYGGVVPREVLPGKAIKVKSQFLVKTDDFLISKRQIVHDACGLVPSDLNGSIVSNEYSVLTPREGCDIIFFNYFAQQPCVSKSFLDSSVGIVIEKMLLKLEWWLKHEFVFPTLDEQRAIADCLSALDNQIAAQAVKIEALKQHKRGLMQQLFPASEEQ